MKRSEILTQKTQVLTESMSTHIDLKQTINKLLRSNGVITDRSDVANLAKLIDMVVTSVDLFPSIMIGHSIAGTVDCSLAITDLRPENVSKLTMYLKKTLEDFQRNQASPVTIRQINNTRFV